MRHHLAVILAALMTIAFGCGSTQTEEHPGEAQTTQQETAAATKSEDTKNKEKSTSEPPAGQVPSYEVAHLGKDQTLYSLAQKHNTTVDRILAANDHISDPRNIPTGEPVLVPVDGGSGAQAAQAGTQDDGGSGSEAGAKTAEPMSDPSQETATTEPKDLSPADLHRGNPDARFWWPTAGEVIRDFNDTLRGYKDPGIGIAAPGGQEVCAVAAGTVRASVDSRRSGDRGWEKVVVIRHDENFVSWYGLLSSRTVEKGEKVKQGQRIGLVSPRGIDGRTQLEFRLYQDEQEVNPVEYLP